MEQLYSTGSSGPGHALQKPHTLATIVPALESACESVSAETAEIEEESRLLLEKLQATVSDLSDLRYGKLSRPSLREEVIEALDGLDRECHKVGKIPSN